MYVSLYGLTFIFVFTANMMLIYGFYKTSRPFKISTKLFIYLSICEMTSILCLVSYAAIRTTNGFTCRYHYIIINAFIYSTFLMALLIFWTISFLRFLSIFKPMYQIKTRTVYKMLLLEVFISLLMTTIITFGYFIWSSTIDELLKVDARVVIGLNLIMIFMNLSLNLSSLIILRRSTNSKARQNGDNVLSNPMVVKQKKRALNTLLLITIIQLVCNLPATCWTIFTFEFLPKHIFILILVICQCLQMSNFGINSLIIILRTKDLRHFYRLKCCLPKVNNTNGQNRGIKLEELVEI